MRNGSIVQRNISVVIYCYSEYHQQSCHVCFVRHDTIWACESDSEPTALGQNKRLDPWVLNTLFAKQPKYRWLYMIVAVVWPSISWRKIGEWVGNERLSGIILQTVAYLCPYRTITSQGWGGAETWVLRTLICCHVVLQSWSLNSVNQTQHQTTTASAALQSTAQRAGLGVRSECKWAILLVPFLPGEARLIPLRFTLHPASFF